MSSLRRGLLRAHLFAALALVVAAPTATPQDDPYAELRAAMADTDRLRAAGKIREARDRLQGTKDLARSPDLDPALQVELLMVQQRVIVATAAAYGRDEDAGWFTPAELERLGPRAATLRDRALGIWRMVINQMAKVPTAEYRAAILADPDQAALRALPAMRQLMWSRWRRPPREVWPRLELRTGDAAFDALFNQLSELEVPEPGMFVKAAHDWIRATEKVAASPADQWVFRWRCALLSPINEGGWPTRHAMLLRPELVREALAALSARAGDAPTGFEALCLVNLAIAAGEHDRARALITTLQGEGGFFYDVAIHHADQLVLRLLQRSPQDEALQALSRLFDEHGCGLAAPPVDPAAKPGEGRRRR